MATCCWRRTPATPPSTSPTNRSFWTPPPAPPPEPATTSYPGSNHTTNSDPTGLCVRLDDLSGPCAETANTAAGQAELAGIEQDRRRQEASWARWRTAQHIVARFNRRTNEDRIEAAAIAE